MSKALNEENLIQFLNHEAKMSAEIPEQFQAYVDELDTEKLREAYRLMRVQRAFDEAATALQRQGELGLWAPSRGQEAAQIGSAFALTDATYVFPSYREHGVALARGLELTDLMGLFRGTDYGSWDPKDSRFHLYSLVIGSHLLHATGYAMGMQRDGSDENAVVYFGDGATSQGDANEALVFAAVNQAPLLFFCQNNQYAISLSAVGQSVTELANRPTGFGIPSLRVDGNDVLAVYAATRFALDHIQAGRGPFFIEALTYRLGAHTTSDDPTKYRDKEEEEYWSQRDPVLRLGDFLRKRGGLDDAFENEISEAATQVQNDIRTHTLALDKPDTETMFAHVYGQEHAQVSTESGWMRDYLSATEQEVNR